MDFIQLLESIFGTTWMSSILQVLSGIVLILISRTAAKLKTKLINSNNTSAKNSADVLDKFNFIKEQTAEQKKQQEATTDAVSTLVNVFAMAFLDSKGISAETKIQISKAIGSLQSVGINTEGIQKAAEKATEKTEQSVEQVNAIIDDTENLIKETKEEAKGIVQKTVDLYNSILDDEQS